MPVSSPVNHIIHLINSIVYAPIPSGFFFAYFSSRAAISPKSEPEMLCETTTNP